ncbi:hypothetical protein A3Q56_06761 [Intoshia linei]|uniref:Uncharacterized protein n=1 Tax=Intoshia linei TaxID=1819745 RepID=A0A177AU36_9BILA|nr:hypothetical protein A3Q56_06761 [Intoshia linei]
MSNLINNLPKLDNLIDENGTFLIEPRDWFTQFEVMHARDRLENCKLKGYNAYKNEILSWKSYNVSILRKKFQSLMRKSNEEGETFIQKLYILSKNCNFTDLNERIRDQLVSGINHPRLENELLSVDFQDLEKCKLVVSQFKIINFNYGKFEISKINLNYRENNTFKCLNCGRLEHYRMSVSSV